MSNHMSSLIKAICMAVAALCLALGGSAAVASEVPAPALSPTATATPSATESPVPATTPAPVADTPAPVAEPPAPPAPAPLPPCEDEDGPGPCRWDAAARGNGVGRSYTIDPNGTVWYDDAAPSPVPGYVYSGEAHFWGGPTDGTGEAGIDSRYHDRWGFPKREVLPSCSEVGSNETCAADGYRILVWEDCSRMIVTDDGAQYVPERWTRPGECVGAVTHQWPDDEVTGAGRDDVQRDEHEDRAGLFGARDDAATGDAASSTVSAVGGEHSPAVSAVPDVTASPTAPAETVTAPAGELARTGLDAATGFGMVIILMMGGVILIAHHHGPRER